MIFSQTIFSKSLHGLIFHKYIVLSVKLRKSEVNVLVPVLDLASRILLDLLPIYGRPTTDLDLERRLYFSNK